MVKRSTQNPLEHLQLRVKIKENFMFSELGPESVILNLDNGVYYSVSGVAECVWKNLISQPVNGLSVQELSERVLQSFDGDPAVIQGDLVEFLQTLRSEGLIET